MRGLGVLAVLAGCGRLGFGTAALVDGGVTGETAQSDGASSDGTGSNASGSDAATIAPCCPDYIICDHFEGASIDTSTWTAGSMVSLDATRAHGGEGSVHIHTPAFNAGNTSYKFLSETKTVAVASTFWVRGWFYLS